MSEKDDPIPSTIGRYAVKRLLGAGAMGSVYLAEDPNIKRRIAIKMVKKGILLSEADRHEVFARFQREAEVSGLLNHPSIVAIYDFGESEVGTYLAMEFVEGNALDALIKSREPLPMLERFRILKGVGEALDHAHSKGIVHRDVKPGNVMIGLDGRPKLMDFGIAKREDASLTQTGTFLGTPSYASPEQIREGVVDNRSDVFSFGVMAFEMFSGRTPFPGSSINTILYKIVNEPPVMPEPCVEGILPESWVRIFEKVLAKRPENRYQTCMAFFQDLKQAFSNLDAESRIQLIDTGRGLTVPSQPAIPIDRSTHNDEATVSTKRKKSSTGKYLVAIALPLAILGGFLVFRSFKPAPKQEPNPAPVSAPAAPAKGESDAASVPPIPAEVVAATGMIKLSGAFSVQVKIDGSDTGEWQPGKTLELLAGPHQIELRAPKYYFKDSQAVTVVAGKTIPLTLPQLSSVTVFTTFDWGLVTIDGQPTGVESQGIQPITLANGSHTIGIKGTRVQYRAEVRSSGKITINSAELK